MEWSRGERGASLSPGPLLTKLWRARRSPLSSLLFKPDKPRVLSHSSQGSQPFHQLTCPPLDTCSLNCGAQSCTQCSGWGCTNTECNRIKSPRWTSWCLMHPRMHLTHTDTAVNLKTASLSIELLSSHSSPFLCLCPQYFPLTSLTFKILLCTPLKLKVLLCFCNCLSFYLWQVSLKQIKKYASQL